MCGIAGIVDTRGEGRIDAHILRQMIHKLAHRGPDDTGFYFGKNFALAFARLSIIDLEGGKQPMFNEDQSIVSICNGEIFNYKTLKNELEKQGHRFTSQSDAEVIPHLYEQYGYEFVTRLNGQFACVLYDMRRDLLFAARDHFGIVPFFYTISDGLFLFGSEVKAILEHPLVQKEVDLIGLDQIFSLPGVISPRTLFKNISSLENGHYLTLQAGQMPWLTEYWDLCYPKRGEIEYIQDEQYYIERLDELLTQAVRYRLQADVPTGLYISGGLDSSLIAARVKMLEPQVQKHSFSIDFPDKELSEARHQRIVARHVGSRHHEYLFQDADIGRYLADVIYHCEYPLKETFDTAAFLLSRCVHEQGIKVILTGQGADELFAGYIGYRFDQFKRSNSQSQGQISAEEAEIRRHLWGDETFLYEKDLAQSRQILSHLYSDAVRAALASNDSPPAPLLKKERLQGLDLLHRRSYVDYKLRLCNHLLVDHGDRMTFAHSVECRYPFLDQELVDFARAIPPHLKLNGLNEKYILKKIAEKSVPASIISREKFGFAAPGSPRLLQQNIFPAVNDLLSPARIQRQGYFNPATVERLRRQYAEPDFYLNVPFDDDLLITVITFGILLDTFDLPTLS